jgi:hypothetical protein
MRSPSRLRGRGGAWPRMSDDILCGLEGEFEFEITYPRRLTDHEYFYGEWSGPVGKVDAAQFPAYTLQTEPLGDGRYRIRVHVVNWTKPGEYLNHTSEVRDLLGQPVEQVRPPFRSVLVQGYAEEPDEDGEE